VQSLQCQLKVLEASATSPLALVPLARQLLELARKSAGLPLPELQASLMLLASDALSKFDGSTAPASPPPAQHAKLAKALNVSPEDLKHYDNREPIADLMDSDPKLMRDFYSLQGQPRFALFDFWVLPKAFNARAALSASAFSSKPR